MTETPLRKREKSEKLETYIEVKSYGFGDSSQKFNDINCIFLNVFPPHTWLGNIIFYFFNVAAEIVIIIIIVYFPFRNK